MTKDDDAAAWRAQKEDQIARAAGMKEHPRILDAEVAASCPTCGRAPTEKAIYAGVFDLGKVSWSTTITVGLWGKDVLVIFGGAASVVLGKEEAHALASRLHRYAEELP